MKHRLLPIKDHYSRVGATLSAISRDGDGDNYPDSDKTGGDSVLTIGANYCRNMANKTSDNIVTEVVRDVQNDKDGKWYTV